LTGGAGLGLTIVKQLVEALGGWVRAENTDDPEGVSVTFALPIADGPALGADTSENGQSGAE